MRERAFVIIKPESIANRIVGQIIDRFEKGGLSIVEMKTCRKTENWVEQHYSHLEESILTKVKEAMAGLLIGIIFEGNFAVAQTKKILGCTDPMNADVGTIRGDLGKYPLPRNLAHASDADCVNREIELFFNPLTDIQ